MTTEENPPVSPFGKGDQILRPLPKKCVLDKDEPVAFMTSWVAAKPRWGLVVK